LNLTSYLLQVSDEAGWPMPKAAQEAMTGALRRFVQGRLLRASEMPSADLVLRKGGDHFIRSVFLRKL
jgi:hypothetical protein